MAIPIDTVLRRCAEISTRELPEGGVIMNLRSGEFFELNRVGFQIWGELDGARDLGAICEEINRRYPIDQARLAADVSGLLEALLQAGLVERR